MKLDVKIPFSKIKKIQCYVNSSRSTAQIVQSSTGADLVINTAIFDMGTNEILSRVVANGRTYGTKSSAAWGLGFNDDGSVVKTWDNGQNCSNYLGPYSYAVVDSKVNDGLNDKAYRGRMLIGITDDSLVVLGFDDSDSSRCRSKTACEGMLGRGCTFAINMDGGGSIQWASKNNKYKTCFSGRKVPAFLCIYLKEEESEDNNDSKEDDVNNDNTENTGDKKLRAVATKKMNVYDKYGNKESGRYIAKNDVCEIGKITSNLLIPVTYPVSNGTRDAYVKSLENFTQA